MIFRSAAARVVVVTAIISLCTTTIILLLLGKSSSKISTGGARRQLRDSPSLLYQPPQDAQLVMGRVADVAITKQGGDTSLAAQQWHPDCPVNLTVEEQRIASSTAFVTLLSGDSKPYKSYGLSARVLLHQVRCQLGAAVDTVVIVTSDIKDPMREALISDGSKLVEVDPAVFTPPALKGTLGRYKDQFGKFAIFNMTEYKQVVYLDADLIIHGNISQLLTALPPAMEFGGVEDFGIVNLFKHSQRYFNGGLFIVRPSTVRFDHIMDAIKLPLNLDYFSLAEQDWLNWYFGPSFYVLPPTFNIQFLNCGIYDYYPGFNIDDAVIYHFKGWDAWDNCFTISFPKQGEKLARLFSENVKRFRLIEQN